MKTPDSNFRDRAQQITALVEGVQQLPDPRARSQVQEIVKRLLDLHGTALELILDRLAATGPAGLDLIDSLAQDELVGSLMLLYGLHPQDLESRVRQALGTVRPLLNSHGGNVELLGITEGTVRLRLLGSCHGCPSSAMTLKLAIEEAILNAAPDVTSLEVDGVAEPRAPERAMLVPLELLQMSGVRGDGGSARVLSSGAHRAPVTGQPLPLSGGEGP